MASEQEKTLAALKSALQMETDGEKYYLKASQQSSNDMGKKLLTQLAAEETIHRKKFEQIFEVIQSKKAWPVMDIQTDNGKGLRTIFTKATEEMGNNSKAMPTELDAVQNAVDMERKTYDFYKNRSQKATYEAEKKFYDALTAQEQAHQLALLDYYEYLKDPAAWFVEKEHPSLDGG